MPNFYSGEGLNSRGNKFNVLPAPSRFDPQKGLNYYAEPANALHVHAGSVLEK